ncbi:NAD(P)/FAD-dependent oxidoreductase [Pelagibacterium lacus]|uniref:FAD-binding oxidoreductase n=1 Tax=Pelagibacterium lacus TaxID=2282655 RepID=A0A369W7R7_9HYPH|nr:FAD-dependent oxidoreductase [Pelagibacterium lacus]RDE09885.1 FAD-binding oxidoreductase [Pelagibacterium lacus]
MRHLDLRSGKPVWLSYRTSNVAERPLEKDISTEILIIGMGISGAMTADLLTEAGHQVAMIDRRGPSRGSTPATTALVQFEIDVPLTVLKRKIGSDKAIRAWRRARLAVQNLSDRINEIGIGCRLVERPTLFLAGNLLSGTALRAEADARSASGLSARYLTPAELRDQFGIDRKGAILSHGNLALDPVKLTAGLLRAAIGRGARLYAPEEAVAVHNGRDEVRVDLRSGRHIRANTVVLATGYELLDPGQDERHQIISTWAIATRRQKDRLWPGEALIWEASDPYLYLRTTHDGRVICGGEDAEFEDEAKRDALLPQKTDRIAAKLGKLLPHIDPRPEFAWAGSFGNTATGLPLIGPLPGKPRLFALMGYGGNGITFSRIAAERIRSHLNGVEDTDADIFAL